MFNRRVGGLLSEWWHRLIDGGGVSIQTNGNFNLYCNLLFCKLSVAKTLQVVIKITRKHQWPRPAMLLIYRLIILFCMVFD